MNKREAVNLFGTTITDLAKALGLTRSAVSQWPDELRPEQEDRVVGAAVRLGRIRVTVPIDHDPSQSLPDVRSRRAA